MKKAIFALLAAALFATVLVPTGKSSVAIAATPSPQPTYCAPPNPIIPGAEVKAVPLQQNFNHAEQCGGQLGDVYTDGPFYLSTAAFTGSSLTVTFPANVFVVLGNRVYAAQIAESAPASATSYWFLDYTTGLYTAVLTNSPPTSTSELEYTVVATSSGISSVSYGTSGNSTPVYASLILSGSVTASDLTATNQAGNSGFMATYTSAGKLVATATPTPMPTPCPIAGTNIAVSGAWPSCTVNSTGSAVNELVAGQNITLTPPGGTGNVTVADTVTPGPQATPSPTPTGCGIWSGSWPYTNDTTACAGLATANAFTNGQSVAFNAASTCGPESIAASEFCVTGTSTVGVLVGAASGVWSGGSATANSQDLTFCKSVSGTVTCPENIFLASGGTLTFNGGSTLSTSNAPLTTGTGNLTGGKSFQGASCALSAAGTMATGSHACKLTFTGITSLVVTFATGTAYATQAICFAQDETTTNGAKVTACSTTSATVTATSGDVVDFFVTGI